MRIINPMTGEQYERIPVKGDGDCGYTAFGITRQDAHTLIKAILENKDSIHHEKVKSILILLVEEMLCTDKKFIKYLPDDDPTQDFSAVKEAFRLFCETVQGPDKSLENERTSNLKRYAQDLNVLLRYIDYDIRVNKLWAHPLILFALASIQKLQLRLWELNDVKELKPHQNHPESPYPESEGEPTDLLFINRDHFERLQKVLEPAPNLSGAVLTELPFANEVERERIRQPTILTGERVENGKTYNFQFHEKSAPGEEDSGFWAVKAMRNEVVETLLPLSKYKETRVWLADEIESAFIEDIKRSNSGWSFKWKKAWQKVDGEYQKRVGEAATGSNPPNDSAAAEKIVALQKARQRRTEFFLSEELFRDYIKAFDPPKNGKIKALRLGYKSANAYARNSGIQLYVWKLKENALGLNAGLELVNQDHIHVPPLPKCTVHICLSADGSFTQYSRLIPVQEKDETNIVTFEPDEFKKAVDGEDREIIKRHLSGYLIWCLQRFENSDNRLKPDFFFWIFDSFVAPIKPEVKRNIDVLYKKIEEKTGEIFEKKLQVYQHELMIKIINGLARQYKENNKVDKKISQSSSGILNYYQALTADDFKNFLPKNELKNFERRILKSDFGNKIIWDNQIYRFFVEPYSEEALFLQEDENQSFAQGGFIFYQERNLSAPKNEIAEKLKNLLTPGSKDYRVQLKRLGGSSIEKGIFQLLLYSWKHSSTKEEKESIKEWVGRLFAHSAHLGYFVLPSEVSNEISIILEILVRIQALWSLPIGKFATESKLLFNEKRFGEWLGRANLDIRHFLDLNSPTLNIDQATAIFKEIENECIRMGKLLCSTADVCQNYLSYYSENSDQWLCEAAREMYIEHFNPEASHLRAQWFEGKAFKAEDIARVFSKTLAELSDKESFSRESLEAMERFVKNQPSKLTLDILYLYAQVSRKGLEEFSSLEIFPEFDKPNSLKGERLAFKKRHLNGNEVIKFISINEIFYELKYKENLFDTFMENFLLDTGKKLKSFIDEKINENSIIKAGDKKPLVFILDSLDVQSRELNAKRISLHKEIDELSYEKNFLSSRLDNDLYAEKLEISRIEHFLNLPMSVSTGLELDNRLLDPILRKIFRRHESDINPAIREKLGIEIARIGFYLEELKDENGRDLFSIFITKNVSVEFFEEFLKKVPNPLGLFSNEITIISNNSPTVKKNYIEYLWDKALEQRGKKQSPAVIRLFIFLNHMRDVVFGLNYIGRHLFNDLYDYRNLENILLKYLLDITLYFEKCYKNFSKKPPFLSRFDLFNKLDAFKNRGIDLGRVFGTLWRNLSEERNFRALSSGIESDRLLIESGPFGGSELLKVTREFENNARRAVSSPNFLEVAEPIYKERSAEEARRKKKLSEQSVKSIHGELTVEDSETTKKLSEENKALKAEVNALVSEAHETKKTMADMMAMLVTIQSSMKGLENQVADQKKEIEELKRKNAELESQKQPEQQSKSNSNNDNNNNNEDADGDDQNSGAHSSDQNSEEKIGGGYNFF